MPHFDAIDYLNLSDLFRGVDGDPYQPYAGYRPNVAEIPNGDGNVDEHKRYLHVAPKYNPPDFALGLYYKAFGMACAVAAELGVRKAMMPDVRHCALRVLDYPSGVGSELHTDFSLLTLNLFRSPRLDVGADNVAGCSVHIGELGELEGLGPAAAHLVPALPGRQQSLVFFAIPDHEEWLRDYGQTVGEWLDERIKRSRVYK